VRTKSVYGFATITRSIPAGGLLDSDGIIHQVVSITALATFIKDIYD
jgi:hypothetical protein